MLTRTSRDRINVRFAIDQQGAHCSDTEDGKGIQGLCCPWEAEQLGHRIGREQRMFETHQAALGGSKTADNTADAADLSQFDPSITVGSPVAVCRAR
jgi:hypothetical protein